MADQIGGKSRYATAKTPAISAITRGSAVEIVSTVDEAIGLAPSMTFPVCCAAPTTVCNHESYLICESGFDEHSRTDTKIIE